MGTKLNPGGYDCYAKAEPDEPMFVLLARDKTAPLTVEFWRIVNSGEWSELGRLLNAAMRMSPRFVALQNENKIDEAAACKYDMEAWFRMKGQV